MRRQGNGGDRLGVLEFPRSDSRERFRQGNTNDLDKLILVAGCRYGAQVCRDEVVNLLSAVSRRKVDLEEFSQRSRLVADFLSQFASCSFFGSFIRFPRSGGNLKQVPTDRVSVLPNEQYATFVIDRDDSNGPGMFDDFPRGGASIGEFLGVHLTEINRPWNTSFEFCIVSRNIVTFPVLSP